MSAEDGRRLGLRQANGGSAEVALDHVRLRDAYLLLLD